MRSANSKPEVSGSFVFVMSTDAVSPFCIHCEIHFPMLSPRTMPNPNP